MCDKQSLPLASSSMGQQTRFHVLQVKGVRVSSRTFTTDGNQIGAAGAESLAGVLGRCAGLAYLNLSGSLIHDLDGLNF